MNDIKRVHIQGKIGDTPKSNDKGDYACYTFSVIPDGRNEPVRVIAWGYNDFPLRYRNGDKVIISGSKVSIKLYENGNMSCYPVIRAETIILEH